MVILVVFNSFNVVKNLKKPNLVARQKPPFYTTYVKLLKLAKIEYQKLFEENKKLKEKTEIIENSNKEKVQKNTINTLKKHIVNTNNSQRKRNTYSQKKIMMNLQRKK